MVELFSSGFQQSNIQSSWAKNNYYKFIKFSLITINMRYNDIRKLESRNYN